MSRPMTAQGFEFFKRPVYSSGFTLDALLTTAQIRASRLRLMDFQMPPEKVEALLNELCVVLGFCLPPDANAKLKSDPPVDPDEFADAVIRAEGLDPYAEIPLHLRRDIRNRVAKHFKDAEDAFFEQRKRDTA